MMRAGLIKYCRFCPKCVSRGQRQMWRSTPKTSGKSLRKHRALKLPGALKFFISATP